jgi:hypothetical protein
VWGHEEAAVRRAALLAAGQVLAALPPAFVAGALQHGSAVAGDGLLGRQLQWMQARDGGRRRRWGHTLASRHCISNHVLLITQQHLSTACCVLILGPLRRVGWRVRNEMMAMKRADGWLAPASPCTPH